MRVNHSMMAHQIMDDHLKEKDILKAVDVKVGEADTATFPEGGKGWFVVFGCVFISFMTFGMINAYGVFQTYYETVLFPNTSSSKLSIIGACQASIIYFFTPLTLPLIHAFGVRNILTLGGSLTIIGFFGLSTTSNETQLWKCYLFQAVFFPLGSACMFPPVMFSPIEWFKTKRAVALGISMCGVGLGGTIWPIIFINMIDKHGFKWTVRTIAFLYIPLSLGAIFFIPQKLEARYVHKSETISNSKFTIVKVKQLPRTYIKIFKNWLYVLHNKRYIFLLICNLIGMFGSYPAIFYLDYFATIINPGTTLTKWLIVVYNVMGAPGRVVPALIADKIGRLNVLILSLGIAGVSILALWIPSIKYEYISIYTVFVIIFGSTIGPLFSLFPAVLGQLFGLNNSDARLGLFLGTSTPGPILGCLIAGSFIPVDSDSKDLILHSYYKLVIYSGVMMVCTSLGLLVLRLSISRKPLVFL